MHPSWNSFRTVVISFFLAIATALVIVSAFIPKAKADEPTTGFTGCGIGAYGAFVTGGVDAGGGFLIGTEGQMAGLTANCDLKTGKGVIGLGIDYGKAFGNLDKIGLNAEISPWARAGYLVNKDVLVYGVGAWSRLDTDFGNIDGFKFGGGIEFKLPDSPMFIDLRAMRGFYSDALSSGYDLESTVVELRATWKFGPKEMPSIFTDEVAKPCDKKMANCK